jgi:WD40 repeat protein
VLDVAVSQDGKLLAIASHGGTMEIYNLDPLGHIKTLEVSSGPVNQVLFTHDGKYLIVGLEDGTLRIFGLHP